MGLYPNLWALANDKPNLTYTNYIRKEPLPNKNGTFAFVPTIDVDRAEKFNSLQEAEAYIAKYSPPINYKPKQLY